MSRGRKTRVLGIGVAALGAAAAALGVATWLSLAALPAQLPPGSAEAARARILDRSGGALAVTLENRWNLHDRVPIHRLPPLLVEAVVQAEDQRFFAHHGVDWRARLHAAWQNLRARRVVRGASTISEQVAGLLTPRPRGLWSRWLEGFEARRLERRFGKGAVLELYLNQVPYGGRRRGVAQAAHFYFDRDPETLDAVECLALAVLVRSPGRLDPRRASDGGAALARGIARLARRLAERGRLAAVDSPAALASAPLELRTAELPVAAPHFVRHVRARLEAAATAPRAVVTTLDGALQRRVGALLEHQIELLSGNRVSDGAVLVVDHRRDEVLAWVNAGAASAAEDGSWIDAVVAPRQPGSTLKPFLYALALERGWTAATLIDDAPFVGPVGRGLHAYRNYSRRFYGPVRLRVALGNSLNVPAARTAQALGSDAFYGLLRELGFESLERHPEFYGEGLALGNGEVTLYELVRAYAALARGGALRPLRVLRDREPPGRERRVLTPETTSLIADILSDPAARRLEFGPSGVLELPIQTAVKTGTSNDYRDAWAVGFSERHTVGVWMGNLDRRAMRGVSGAVGPALVLRGVFAELARDAESRPLRLSPALVRSPVCRLSGHAAGKQCPAVEEWFRPGRAPAASCTLHATAASRAPAPAPPPRLVQPTPGLDLALDPRIPDHLEAFPFQIEAGDEPRKTVWLVDGERVGVTGAGERRFVWRLVAGEHVAQARVWRRGSDAPVETARVAFRVR